MNPSLPNLHSTRLENLGIEPYGARFDLDGRTVQIRGDSRTPLVGALQAFHQAALDDYRARQPEPKPGWFSRLKSWIGRLFAGPSTGSGQVPSTSSGQAPSTRPAAEPLRRVPAAEPRPVAETATDPVLRAVYADKDGVHLVWQPHSGKSKAKEVATTSSLDSQLAQRLQDCYSHLAELGYKVAGLELLRPAAPAPQPEEGRVAEAPARQRAPRVRPAPVKPVEPAAPVAKGSAEALPEPGL
jgi:hypothetical protein